MRNLNNRRILLGICGGIAAYKSAELTRRLKQAGADVRVVMTASAMEFVTPLTFQALSGHPVHTELVDAQTEAAMGHIELARWADAILIAPASANTIANLVHGKADALLPTLCLASDSPLVIAPAMNTTMWQDLTTQANCNALKKRGVIIFGPASGELACGEIGEGRMLEVEELVEGLAGLFESGELQGLSVVVTAGPTYEPIDPVRYIGNRSSGKMGYAIAEAASEAGAAVTLISGPTSLETPDRVRRIDIETAEEMFDAVRQNIGQTDIYISVAAIADYRPAEVHDNKIKKDSDSLTIELTKNTDILSWVASSRDDRPFTVGFAAETENLEDNAKKKLREKNIDMIAANRVGKSEINKQDIGFNEDENAIDLFWHEGNISIDRMRKKKLAKELIRLIGARYQVHSALTKSKDSA